MGANKHFEIVDKTSEAANTDASDNKMEQIRELMFGGGWKNTRPAIASKGCAAR
jgi:hypothetical protein